VQTSEVSSGNKMCRCNLGLPGSG